MPEDGDDARSLAMQLGQGAASPFALGLLLRQAHEQVLGSIDPVLKPLGIERRHLMVLMRLVADGPLSQKQLVERTSHDKAGMVRIVDDLERMGLATREPVPGDRRSWAVTMTAKGREIVQAAGEAAVPASTAAVSALTGRQLQQLRHLLELLVTSNGSRA